MTTTEEIIVSGENFIERRIMQFPNKWTSKICRRALWSGLQARLGARVADGADHRRGCGMHLACRSVAAEIGGRADRLEQVHSDAFNNLVKFVFDLRPSSDRSRSPRLRM